MKKLTMRGAQGTGAPAEKLNRKRFFKRKANELRYLKFGRRPRTLEIIPQGRRSSIIMDAIFPERVKKWKPNWKRNISNVVTLENFSFLDNPKNTIENLRLIAVSEAEAADIRINFDDKFCLDIAPYMIIALMRDQMLPIVRGGRMRHSVGKVINSVHLSEMMKIGYVNDDYQDVWPFSLKVHSPRRPSYFLSPTKEEKHDSGFVKALGAWLNELDLELTQEGRGQLSSLIGEILDNATRHSDPIERKGTWAMAGFMAKRAIGDEGAGGHEHVCHISIVSLGLTMHQTLQMAPEQTRGEIQSYAARHAASGISEEAL